jgi:Tfp pilus assembly protein PilF
MNSSFLEKLLKFYEEDPGDPFNLYALALEYQKTDVSKAGEMYDELLDSHPDYLPTYYHAAMFFGNLEQIEKADLIYKKGIKLAGESGNNKTLGELQRAYKMFLEEQEEW